MYKLKQENTDLNVDLIIVDLTKSYENDFRIIYLKKIGVCVIHVLSLVANHSKLLQIYFQTFDYTLKLSKYNINFSTNNFGIAEDCHLSIMHFISQYIRNINFRGNKKMINARF